MYTNFSIFPKMLYVITFLAIQYLKIYVINIFTENHLLPVLMITDIIYFPFYIIERFAIQNFGISIITSFIWNISLGVVNLIMILIFNEILECKFWGLNENFAKNINERQKEEYLDDNIEKENDSNMEEMKEGISSDYQSDNFY